MFTHVIDGIQISELLLQGPDLATEDEYWNLWEAVKVDDIDVVIGANQAYNKTWSFDLCFAIDPQGCNWVTS